MIELTNGLIRIKVPNRDLDSYLKLGWKKVQKAKKVNSESKNGKVKTSSDSKQEQSEQSN